MPRDREIAELIADVKEHILYLQELGVDSLGVNLASVFSGSVDRDKLIVGRSATGAETFAAPARESAPYRETPARPPANAGGSDKGAGSRLASLPSLPKRMPKPQPAVSSAKKPEVSKPKSEAESEILFSKIGPALVETAESVEEIWAEIGNCTRCPLSEERTQVVHTTGNFNADLMFIGEAPGRDEDEQGEPFVGRAGQLLNKIIAAIGMTRSDVAIGNINRCRPPGNRTPTLDEAHTCRPFLLREIAVIKPKVIVVMGNTALHNLLDTKAGITKVRGRFQDYFGVKVMPTFHPAYLLRDPNKKRETWEDMKMVRDYLNSVKSA
ncbi:MAG: uracil-DNA glycosylase [Pyrinomonadaceae bacterium]